nr:hypothetical protein [Microvirga rosea]
MSYKRAWAFIKTLKHHFCQPLAV